MDAIYISSSSFKVLTDLTSEFNLGRRVKADCGLDGVKYSAVVSASYSDPYTTVTIDESDLTASLVYAWYGFIQTGATGSFPDHLHDGAEGSGGVLEGEAFGFSLLSLSDTPTTYLGAENQFLKVNSTASGVEFADAATSFLELTDTPPTYSGFEDLYLRVTTTGIDFSYLSTSGIDDHSHAAYSDFVTWDFGVNTISGTGDIYCNDIYTSAGTVYIGDAQLSATDGNIKIKNNTVGGLWSVEGSGNSDLIPEYISVASYYSTGSSSFIFTKPAGLVENDVMVASLTIESSSELINSVPSGWTLLYTGSLVIDPLRMYVYYKVAGGSEPANYTWGLSSSLEIAGGVMAFRNVDTNTPIGNFDFTEDEAGGNMVAPSIDTLVENEMVISTISRAMGVTISPPAGYTESYERRNPSIGAQWITSQASYKTYPTPGATGEQTSVPGGGGTWINLHMALNPFLTGEPRDVIKTDANGPVELYYAGDKAVETTATSGINVTNEVTAITYYGDGSNLTISGIDEIHADYYYGDGSNLTGIPGSSGIDDHGHAAYVPWEFGASTISGTGDIYCNDIYTSAGTVYIGEANISSVAGNTLIKNNTLDGTITLQGTGSDLTTFPEFISATEYGKSTSGASFTCDRPTGVVEGDFMIAAMVIELDGVTAVGTLPEGWTHLYTYHPQFYPRTEVHYKIAGPSEPGTYTWTADSSFNEMSMGIAAYRNVDPDNPIGNHERATDGGGNDLTAPTIDVTTINAMVLHVSALNFGTGGITPPSGYEEAINKTQGSGNTYKTIALSHKNYPVGATGAQSSYTGLVDIGTAAHIEIQPFQSGQPTDLIKIDPAGSTELYHAGQKALETTATSGINVLGEVTAAAYYGDGSNLTGISGSGGDYVPWDFGAGTISGTGDIYCNDIFTSSGTVYIGDLQLTSSGGELLIGGEAFTNGVDGTVWTIVSGVPNDIDGNVNDIHLNLINYDLYQKYTAGTTSPTRYNNTGMPHTAGGFVNGTLTAISDGGGNWAQFSDGLANPWAAIDLGTSIEVNKVLLQGSASYPDRMMKDFKIQASHNNVDWVDILTDITTSTTGENIFNFTSPGIAYRYWRVYVLSDWGGNNVLFTRFELYEFTPGDVIWGNPIGNLGGGEPGAAAFIDHTDTPDDYGTAGQVVASTGSGIEFSNYSINSVTSDSYGYELIQEWTLDNEEFDATISGLSGDTTDSLLMVQYDYVLEEDENGTMGCQLNGDSDGDNYVRSLILSTGSGQFTVTDNPWWGADNLPLAYVSGNTGAYAAGRTHLYLLSGKSRSSLNDAAIHQAGGTAYYSDRSVGIWENAVDEVTSIRLRTITYPAVVGNITGTVKLFRYAPISLPIPVASGTGDGWTYSTEHATTSGTIVTFDDIPSDTTSIEVMLAGVQTSTSTKPAIIQLGDAGGIETSGYSVTHELATYNLSATDGWHTIIDAYHTNTMEHYGCLKLHKFMPSQNLWLGDCNFMVSGGNSLRHCAGHKTLTGELTSVALRTVDGIATFTGGSATIRYR